MSRRYGWNVVDDGSEKRNLLKDDADRECDAVQHPAAAVAAAVPGLGPAAVGVCRRAKPRVEARRLCV